MIIVGLYISDSEEAARNGKYFADHLHTGLRRLRNFKVVELPRKITRTENGEAITPNVVENDQKIIEAIGEMQREGKELDAIFIIDVIRLVEHSDTKEYIMAHLEKGTWGLVPDWNMLFARSLRRDVVNKIVGLIGGVSVHSNDIVRMEKSGTYGFVSASHIDDKMLKKYLPGLEIYSDYLIVLLPAIQLDKNRVLMDVQMRQTAEVMLQFFQDLARQF